MNTLVRNTTLSLSSRRIFNDGYEELERNHGRVRTFSKRKKEPHLRAFSSSYRLHRAKQRQIFLKSYKLAPVDTIRRRSSWSCSEPNSSSNKLVLKVKKAVVSMVSLLRIGSVSSFLRSSCDSPSAVHVSSPAPPVKGLYTN